MKPDEPVEEPRRLLADDGPTTELLRDALDGYRAGLDESGAWKRLQKKRQLSLAAFGVGAVALSAAAALALWFGVRSMQRSPDEGANLAERETVRALQKRAAKRDQVAPVPARAERQELNTGRNVLADGSVAELASGSKATITTTPESSTRVDLTRGQIDLVVVPQPAGRRFEVLVDRYRLEVIGTRFRVDHDGKRTDVQVKQGVVVVWSGAEHLAAVESGQRWSSAALVAVRKPVEEPANPPPKASPADNPVTVDCLNFARQGKPKDAEACFLERASGSGMAAQLALYELARLRKDALGDPAGAYGALTDYRQRFPDGSLRTEVEISAIEVLVRLGRHDEALAESARLLESTAGKARAGQLRMLRGNIYRTALRDCGKAETEYASIINEPGARGDQAQYFRASCLEEVGRRDEAVQAYREYLKRPGAARAAQVEQKLQKLAP
jgi:ferric-dicitrate binding protein FerR (iron transport regulator)